jgi:hypothetical protein
MKRDWVEVVALGGIIATLLYIAYALLYIAGVIGR